MHCTANGGSHEHARHQQQQRPEYFTFYSVQHSKGSSVPVHTYACVQLSFVRDEKSRAKMSNVSGKKRAQEIHKDVLRNRQK